MKSTAINISLATLFCLTPFSHGLATPLAIGPCGSGEPLVVTSTILFSDLDGGCHDLDAIQNGTAVLHGLVVEGYGKIVIDVPFASFLVNGPVLLQDSGKIDNDVWPLCESGPQIFIDTCGSFEMRDYSRIRSRGSVAGGLVSLNVNQDFYMSGIAAIDCTAFNQPEGSYGGHVSVCAGGKITMDYFMNYITVVGTTAGCVNLHSGDCADDAVAIRGRVLANGTGRNGMGGTINVSAQNGGLYLPGSNKCRATGQMCDGDITLEYYTVIGPSATPFMTPDPIITQVF